MNARKRKFCFDPRFDMSREDALRLLGVSYQTLLKYCREGKISRVKYKRDGCYSRTDVVWLYKEITKAKWTPEERRAEVLRELQARMKELEAA